MEKKELAKLSMSILGITLIIGTIIYFIRVFIMAYLHPSNRIILNINSINEGLFELILIILLLPGGIYIIYKELKEINWFGIGDKT